MENTITQTRRLASAPPTINVTPLIDVLLVLLIIFFAIQPHNEGKLPVRAPQPAMEEYSDPPPETLMLTISKDSRLALNTRPVSLDGLLPLLANLMKERPLDLRQLFIKAPPRSSYQEVVVFIDLARGAGVTTIGLLSGES